MRVSTSSGAKPMEPEPTLPRAQTASHKTWRRRLAAMVLSVALASVAWAAGRWLATSSLTRHVLRVRSIETTGLVRTSRDEALASAGLRMHQGILALPMAQGVIALEALPWVRRAAIRRQLPDRVFVEVDEHRATLMAQLGELWLVNESGEPFKRFDATDKLVLPMVTGLEQHAARDVPYPQQSRLIARLQEAMALGDALARCRDDIREVEGMHHDMDLGWSVTVVPTRGRQQPASKEAVTAHLGSEPLARLPVLLAALNELSDRRLQARTLWVANERQQGRVQVELAVNAP